MSSLDYEKVWQPVLDDLEPGDTMRINHTNCEAGEDTRKRLYFSRPVGGGDRVLGYCHNCQKGGSFFAGGDYRIDHSSILGTEDISSTDEFKMPKLDAIQDSWPREAKQWLFQYSISAVSARQAEIAYIPSTHRMYIPIYDYIMWTDEGCSCLDYKGYQTRRLWTKGKRPKYDTSLIDAHQTMDTILEYRRDSTIYNAWTSVIVEDFLSGLRIIQCAIENGDENVQVLVNYGTKINVEAIAKLSGEIFVWFDNDNAHVCNQANKVARTASLILKKPVQTILEVSDPKAQSYETIRSKLWT